MGMIFPVFQTFGKNPNDKLLLIKNVILWDIMSGEIFNIFRPMSSRPVDFSISKLSIYFLTKALFISGILKETLLSTFESTHFLCIFKISHVLAILALTAHWRILLKAFSYLYITRYKFIIHIYAF